MTACPSVFNMTTISFIVSVDDDKKGDKTKRAERLRNRNHAKPIGRDERKYLELQALTEAVTHSLDGNSDETRRKAVAQLEEHKKEMREKNLLRKTEIKLRATTVKRLVSSFDETNVGQKNVGGAKCRGWKLSTSGVDAFHETR